MNSRLVFFIKNWAIPSIGSKLEQQRKPTVLLLYHIQLKIQILNPVLIIHQTYKPKLISSVQGIKPVGFDLDVVLQEALAWLARHWF